LVNIAFTSILCYILKGKFSKSQKYKYKKIDKALLEATFQKIMSVIEKLFI